METVGEAVKESAFQLAHKSGLNSQNGKDTDEVCGLQRSAQPLIR